MTKVTISRHWNSPKITTVINDESISLSISMDDFIEALKQEVGTVAFTFKKDTFNKQLDAAIMVIIKKIKQETSKVM